MDEGVIAWLEIVSGHGGEFLLDNPFKGQEFEANQKYTIDGDLIKFNLSRNDILRISTKNG